MDFKDAMEGSSRQHIGAGWYDAINGILFRESAVVFPAVEYDGFGIFRSYSGAVAHSCVDWYV